MDGVTGTSQAETAGRREPPPPAWIRHLPNALTVLRLLMAGAFPFLPAVARFPVALAAGASDAADGWIARRFRVQSPLGALLDGVADKAFVLAVLGTLLGHGRLGVLEVAAVLVRDLVVGLTLLLALLHERIVAFSHVSARLPGKLTTVLLFAWFACLLWRPLHPAAPWVFWPTAAASLWAAGDYGRRAWLAFRGRRELPGPP